MGTGRSEQLPPLGRGAHPGWAGVSRLAPPRSRGACAYRAPTRAVALARCAVTARAGSAHHLGPWCSPARRTTSGCGAGPCGAPRRSYGARAVGGGGQTLCRAPPRSRATIRTPHFRAARTLARTEHHLGAVGPFRVVQAFRAERYLGAVAAIRTPHFHAAWSFARATHHLGPCGPSGLGRRFAPRTTSDGARWQPGACRAPPRGSGRHRHTALPRPGTSVARGFARAAHHLGAVAPARCALAAGPAPSTTSGHPGVARVRRPGLQTWPSRPRVRSRAGMSFSFGETNRPESNPYPENLFLRGSLPTAAPGVRSGRADAC